MSDYIKDIKHLIAEKAGLETQEVQEHAYFEDDLNMGEMELVEVLGEIEEALKIELLDKKDDIETVQDVIDIASEQIE